MMNSEKRASRLAAISTALDRPFLAEDPKKKKWLFIFLVALYLTYYFRGFRVVNANYWSYGYYNYTANWLHGFMPRGLWGTVLRLLNGNQVPSYDLLTVLQYVFGVVFGLYMCWVIYRLVCRAGNMTAFVLLAVYSASTFNMFYLYEMGFLDHILYVLVIVYIEMSLRCKWKTCLIWGGVICAVMPLILETSAFLTCPVITSICAIRLLEEKDLKLKTVCKWLVVAFLPTVAVVIIYRSMPVRQETMAYFEQEMQGRPFYVNDFGSYISIFVDVTMGIPVAKSWVYLDPPVVIYASIVIGITALFLVRADVSPRVMIAAAGLMIACAVASYLMIYVSVDYMRYWFSVVQAPMLVAIYILLRHRTSSIKLREGIVMLCVLLMIVPGIYHYRLWLWNGKYRDFWFVSLARKLGLM